MKKKLIALLLSGCVLSFSACGGEPQNETPAPVPTAEAPASASETPAEAPVEAPAEASGETSVETPETAVENNTKNLYWEANIPETFTADEYNRDDEGYSNMEYTRINASDEVEAALEVTVEEEDTLDFRHTILNRGISMEDLAGGKYPTRTIGGLDFIETTYEYWGDTMTVYYYREGSSHTTVEVEITGDVQDADLAAILDSMKFKIPAGAEVEAPYPWEGAPIACETSDVVMGDYTLSFKQLMCDESFLIEEIFNNRVAADGDLYYLLDDHELRTYTRSGDALLLKDCFDLIDSYEHMSMDQDGYVYLTASFRDALVYKDGSYAGSLPVEDQMAVAPDGTWGITFFMQLDDLVKIDLANDCEESSFTLEECDLESVGDIYIDDKYIYVAGRSKVDDGQRCFVFDYNGKLVQVLGDEDGEGLGYITNMAHTSDFFVGIDGNLRDIDLWTAKGEWIGDADAYSCLGTGYPWINGFFKLSDDTYLISATDERPDGSWEEMIVFEMTITK